MRALPLVTVKKALEEFGEAKVSRLANKASYLMGILRRQERGEERPTTKKEYSIKSTVMQSRFKVAMEGWNPTSLFN